jgi:hypothetical protein
MNELPACLGSEGAGMEVIDLSVKKNRRIQPNYKK